MTRLPASHTNGQENGRAGSVDPGHLLLVGAGPGLGLAIAHRFAVGGYRVTLVARTTDRLGELARNLDDTSAEINTVEADASSPEDLRARMVGLYHEEGAPAAVIYNAVLGSPDQLMSSTAAHLQEAYAVDVIGAVVVAQEAAAAMKRAGLGTMIVTGGGFRSSRAWHLIRRISPSATGRSCRRTIPGRRSSASQASKTQSTESARRCRASTWNGQRGN